MSDDGLPPPEMFRPYIRACELVRLFLQHDNHTADLMLELVPDEELRQLAESLVVVAGMTTLDQKRADEAIELLTNIVNYARENSND